MGRRKQVNGAELRARLAEVWREAVSDAVREDRCRLRKAGAPRAALTPAQFRACHTAQQWADWLGVEMVDSPGGTVLE